MKESKFIQISFHLARQIVPGFWSRFSKHTFTQSQQLSLNALRTRPYREFTELLQEMLRIKKHWSSCPSPHHHPEGLYAPRYSDMESAVEAELPSFPEGNSVGKML